MVKSLVKQSRSLLADALRKPMPHNVKPMSPTLVRDAFDGSDWLFEVKWDGYRAVAEIQGDGVRFYSRNLRPFDRRFKPIVQNLERFHHDAILDGEMVVLDERGIARFEWLQNYPRLGGTLAYYVFDLLYLDGHDLCGLPLESRKSLLSKVLPKLPRVRLCEHVEGTGKAFFQLSGEMGLEGIIAKHRKSLYRPGLRSNKWRKVKHRQTAELVIGGFTKRPTSILLGIERDGELKFVGQVEFGFSRQEIRELDQVLAELVQSECPFARQPNTQLPAKWVKPLLVAEVAFQEFTAAGQLRHPSLVGVRCLA